MITQKEFDRLKKMNSSDKRALDMLDNLMCAYSIYSDFQDQTLKTMAKLEAPTGSFGTLCSLSAEALRNAQDMYCQWYHGVDVISLSEDVFKAIIQAYNDIELNETV